MKRFLLSLILIALCFSSGCSRRQKVSSEPDKGLPSIAVVNYPTGYLVGRLGEGLVDIGIHWPPGVDPAWWQPDDDALLLMLDSDLIFTSGAGYGYWIEMTDIPSRKLINLFEDENQRILLQEGAISHSHGPEGEHSHGEPDSNIWLDPELMKILAANAAAEIRSLVGPENLSLVDQRLNQILDELSVVEDLVEACRQSALLRKGLFLQASHPVYGYVASAVNLSIESFHWDPGIPPEISELQDSVQKSQGGGTIMLWEERPPEAVASALSAAGIQVVVFPPCGGRSELDLIQQLHQSWQALLLSLISE